ncbi:hypothetical protein H1D31_01425 [Alishewanella sp. BS5-314]|uniref:hypothetical protein n=1 Tax=Alishewanella sp. BS5-314 TaxID=2755587 RepID=UPI0021BBA9C4|nr:hypothetical protein [Alishewanella sp. BS5-314]MCT8124697.1 hypothetical protein [Alishewanella sp. BS5-314]
MGKFVCLLLSVSLLTGCFSSLPKCSSDASKEILLDLLIRDMLNASHEVLSDRDLNKYISVINVRTTDYDKKFKRYSCEAVIRFSDQLDYPIYYESVIDEESGEHMIYTNRLNIQQAFGLTHVVNGIILKVNQGKNK